jgi:hypothetical protein
MEELDKNDNKEEDFNFIDNASKRETVLLDRIGTISSERMGTIS